MLEMLEDYKMKTDDPVSIFLDLEQRTTEFLEELGKLREETSHYSKAASGLDSALTHFTAVSERLTDLSQELREVVKTLREIGTAEILESMWLLQKEVKDLREDFQQFNNTTTAQLEAISDYERRGFFGKLFGSKPEINR